MTLQQLRYVIQIATSNSMTAAAARLYMAQSSLSKAVSDLEQEMGITIFRRTATGVVPTDDGERFIAYAREVVRDADLLEARYKGTYGPRPVFAVSSPHNVLVTQAFAEVTRAHSQEFYQFALREEPFAAIFNSVRTQRSELGVLYRSQANAEQLEAAVRAADLHFDPITTVNPVALVATAALPEGKQPTSIAQLSDLPRIEQGSVAEEAAGPLGRLLPIREAPRRVVVSDWETAIDLVVRLGGYTIVFGDVGPARRGISVLHLDELQPVELGLIRRRGFPLSPAARDFSAVIVRLAAGAEA